MFEDHTTLGVQSFFAKELGWCPAPEGEYSSAGFILSEKLPPSATSIHLQVLPDAIRLTWRPYRLDHVIVIPKGATVPFFRERLDFLSANDGHRPQPEKTFDVVSLYRRFGLESSAYLESHLDHVMPVVGKSLGQRTSTEDVRDFLQRCLNRLILLKLLSSRGFASFPEGGDYLETLVARWRQDSGHQLFHQRLSMIYYNAMGEPEPAARAHLAPMIGKMPYLGAASFGQRILFSDNALLQQATVVADSFYMKLLDEGGLLQRYAFDLVPPSDEERVALTPQVLASAFDVMVDFRGGGEAAEAPHSLWAGAQRSVWDHLGHDPSQPLGVRPARVLLDQLEKLKFVDQNCRGGASTVALLGALVDAHRILSTAAKTPHDPGAVARNFAQSSLQAFTRSLYGGQLTTHSLAQTMLSYDTEPQPLPDFSQVVRFGLALNVRYDGAKIPVPPLENERTEFKACFDYDFRQAKRNPERALACLRTVAAFLNSQGGTLYIGIDDQGQVAGIEEELRLIPDASPIDIFEGRIREAMKNSLDPIPLGLVSMSFPEIHGRVVCQIDVQPRSDVTYLNRKDDRTGQMLEEVYVRDGHRTLNLRGRQRDIFVLGKIGNASFLSE